MNIEPASTFHLFPHHRPRDINLKVAVSDVCGTATFVECPDMPAISQLADDAAPAEAPEWGRTVTVPTRTLASILEEHAPPAIDFLSLDVEGHERKALAGNDWARFRPRVLVIEATLPFTNTLCHEGWEPIVLDAGYLFACFDGINRFYVRGDETTLLARLQAPVNVLDNYIPSATAELQNLAELWARRAQELTAQLDSLRAAHERDLAERVPVNGIGPRSLRLGLWLARRLTQIRHLIRRHPAPR